MSIPGMNKKGQVTIFIILAIVLIVIVVLFFVLKDKIVPNNSKDFPEVQTFVLDCIESSGEKAILFSAKKGGIYSPEDTTSEGISYYLTKENNYFPSLDNLENNLELEFEPLFLECIGNFSEFSNYNIQSSGVNTDVGINDKEIIFNLNYPLKVSFENQEKFFNDFKGKVITNYFNFYASAEEFINYQKGEENFCLTCLMNIADSNSHKADILRSGSINTLIFVFYEEDVKLNNETLEFRFANEI